MTEHDPVTLDVEAWADYWANLKAGITFISVTGILAYYQTKVPFHRKGKFLGTRDFFGDCREAAKKRGLRVVARMSPDLNWDDALAAHPEWFERDKQGNAIPSKEEPRLFRTCTFSSYMTDYVPAVIREVTSLYDVDAVYTNGWPPLGSLPVCYCAACSQLPPRGTPAYWAKFNDRVEYLWKFYDSLVKQKNASSFYFANMGGGARASINLARLGKDLRMVSGRQPGPRRRRFAHLALHAARPCLPGDSGRQSSRQRDRRMDDRPDPLAKRRQVAARGADVAQRNQRQRHDSLLAHRRRREGNGRRPPRVGDAARNILHGPRSTIRTSSTNAPLPTWAW